MRRITVNYDDHTSTENLAMYFDTRDSYGTPYFEITPVRVIEGSEMMPNGEMAPSIENLSYHELADLVVYAFGNNISWRDDERNVTGPFVGFRTNTVELRDAERFARVLRRVDKALSKAYDEEGNAAHLGQYMMRVARALGIKRAIWRTDHNRSSTYSEMRFRVVTLGALSDRIGASVAEYEKTGKIERVA